MGAMRALGLVRLAVGLAVVCVAASAGAVEELCIPVEAHQVLACGGPRTRLARARGHTFEVPAADPPRRPRVIPPPERPIAPLRDHPGLRKTERQLVLREIAQTERLLVATPADSKDHPRLQRRLAEAYLELADGFARDVAALEAAARKWANTKPREAAALTARAKAGAARMTRARRRGIDYYRDLVAEHPGYCTSPRHKLVEERGCLDETLYFLAHALEDDGDARAARDVYARLVKEHATSKYFPRANLAVAEIDFDDARRDPSQWPAAATAYRKVLAKPPADNPLWGYAQYKLGHVDYHRGDHARALAAFKKVIEYARAHPTHPHATQLLGAARRDLIPVYAAAGDPRQAHAFFARLSSGPQGTRDMLEDLGVALIDSGHYEAALVLYGDLLDRYGDARACRYRAAVARATMATKSTDKEAIEQALIDLLAHHALLGDDVDLVCANLTAALVTETAMAWHTEAVGSGGVTGTDDPATLAAAARLYQAVEAAFDAEDWPRFRFPGVVRDHWPTLARVHYAHGDLAHHQRDWRSCGRAFSRAFETDPSGPDAAHAILRAARCWHALWTEGQGGSAEPAPRALDEDREAMLRAFDRYVCRIEPAPGDAAARQESAEIALARARLHQEAGHAPEAAVAFRAVALDHAGLEVGRRAAHRYLVALEGMRRRHARSSCGGDLRRDLPALVTAHCGGTARDAGLCDAFARLERDLAGNEVEAAVGAPEGGAALARPSRAEAEVEPCR